jgi:hypothetical protein
MSGWIGEIPHYKFSPLLKIIHHADRDARNAQSRLLSRPVKGNSGYL